jgi:hypothetical protein
MHKTPPRLVAGLTPFSEVLEYFESHGWQLLNLVGSRRVFVKQEATPDGPYVLKIDEGGVVDTQAFERARNYLNRAA